MHRETQSSGNSSGLDEVLADYMRRVDCGEPVDQQALIAAHPGWADELREYFSHAGAVNRAAAGAAADFDDFATTHWSMVVAAGDRQTKGSLQALAELCELYWYPLYAFIRRRVSDIHEAQDFTQAFFVQLIDKRPFAMADPKRGRFRAFLITMCKRFLINEWHKVHAAKRGGGRSLLSLDFDSGETKFALIEVDHRTAEQLYDQQWALTLLERVLQNLRSEYTAKNKQRDFEVLKRFLTGSTSSGAHGEAARALNVREGAVKVAAHRLRARYRDLLRAEIAQTVQSHDEVDDEIRELFTALSL